MKKRKVVKTEPAAEPHSETDESELDVSSDDEEEETLTTPKPIKKKTVKRVQISGVNKPQKIAEITASNPLSPSQATSHQMPPSPPPLPQVSTKTNRIFPISANELLQGKNALKKSSTPGTTERPKPKTTSDDDEFSEDSDS
jgi:hypothetical protein